MIKYNLVEKVGEIDGNTIMKIMKEKIDRQLDRINKECLNGKDNQ